MCPDANVVLPDQHPRPGQWNEEQGIWSAATVPGGCFCGRSPIVTLDAWDLFQICFLIFSLFSDAAGGIL